MNLQVLVATMNQNDRSLVETMNINSDAIIANQCDKVSFDEFEIGCNKIQVYSFAERGIGLNRNNALMRATSEICLLADDDIVYNNDYKELVLKSFQDYKDVDVIIFNLEESNSKRFRIKKVMSINSFNYMRFGSVRIAFRRLSVVKFGISFNLLFGGGAEFIGGEDTLFLRSCLKNKLRVIALPISIGEIVDSRPSTWFSGYNERYFVDRGALFAALSPVFAKLLCIQFLVRRFKKLESNISAQSALKMMFKGVDKYSKMK